MPNPKDGEWQLHITELLAEVRTEQKNMSKKLDAYIISDGKRSDDLEHIVYGNGSEGLAEQVRNIKGKWAAGYGLVLILLSAAASAAAKEAFAFMFK